MYNPIFPFKPYTYPKFIYTGVYLCYLGMCDSEEFIRFCFQLIRAYRKKRIIIYRRNAKFIYLVTGSIAVSLDKFSLNCSFMFVENYLSNTYQTIREQWHDKDYRLYHCSSYQFHIYLFKPLLQLPNLGSSPPG